MTSTRGHLGRIAIIGGTGLGIHLQDELEPGTVERHDQATPFGTPSAPIITGRLGDSEVALLLRHGHGHCFNPTQIPYRANIFALKALGCTHVIASGACGSLQDSIAPGSIVLCDQIIDRTIHRPRTFYDDAAVHVELADPCCAVMRNWLGSAADTTTIHQTGTYLCMEGPAFSTRAESHMHRTMGAHIVGMTAMPEARLAREAELAYALLALPTDWDCWRTTEGDSVLEHVIANLQCATTSALQLIRSALADTTLLQREASHAHTALNLAVFSDADMIDEATRQQLKPLWGRVL
ncbi:MAG: MTAP family purine nucleoside phosphorylase [Phycisphaerales bacterium]|nr:MTAP family purine nucleoside phosphorylase [Phycisphaerales bacterium]